MSWPRALEFCFGNSLCSSKYHTTHVPLIICFKHQTWGETECGSVELDLKWQTSTRKTIKACIKRKLLWLAVFWDWPSSYTSFFTLSKKQKGWNTIKYYLLLLNTQLLKSLVSVKCFWWYFWRLYLIIKKLKYCNILIPLQIYYLPMWMCFEM